MKRAFLRKVIAYIVLVGILVQVPFSNVSANEIGFAKDNSNQKTVYYDGVAFDLKYFDDYTVVTSDQDGVSLEMKYNENDTASVTIDKGNLGEEEYWLKVETEEENAIIEVYQDDKLVDVIDGNYGAYEGQAAIAAAIAGMTLAEWLFSAAATVVISKSVYDLIKSGKVTKGTSRAPRTGKAGSVYEQVDNKGKLVSRTKYGNNKKPEWRQDFKHPHFVKKLGKSLEPHQHNYFYNLKGQPIGEIVTPIRYY